jgi:hypothetical protein
MYWYHTRYHTWYSTWYQTWCHTGWIGSTIREGNCRHFLEQWSSFEGNQKHSLNARAINDLFKDVPKTPAFNANEVDTDILQRLQASIDSGDIQIINMNVEGVGEQVSELFRRPAEKVLRELLADMHLAGCQHFAFHEYKDLRGNMFFAGHSNGSVSFQLAQVRVGEGKVPVSMLYIDSTFLQKGIPIRPAYRKCIYPYHTRCHYWYYTRYNIFFI